MAVRGVGSAVPSLSRLQRQNCIFLLCIAAPAVTDNKKEKEIVICLEKVAKLNLLCALMLTKFHEICLEIRTSVNTHLNFTVLFDILP